METENKKGELARFDVVVLAGDRKASRKVKGDNKAFLDLKGRPVICYVIDGLLSSRYIDDIFIVGPKERIERAISPYFADVKDRKIAVFEQWDNFYENVWNGFLHTIPGHTDDIDPETYRDTPYFEKAVLAVSGDIPLLTGYEVDEFLENTDTDNYDYQPGTTADCSLMPYYPKKDKKGIKHAYFHYKEARLRQNNIHLGNLFKIKNKTYIEKMYEFRHQREWKDIIKLTFEILRTEKGSYKALYYFILLQMCMFFTRIGFNYLSDKLRRLISLSDVEKTVGLMLGGRAKSIMTTYGGAALDIDSDEEFDTIKENFDDWMAFQEELYRTNRGG